MPDPLPPPRSTGHWWWTPRARQVLRWTVVLATAAFIARVAANNVDELRTIDLRLHPGWLLPAVPLTASAALVLPMAWRQILGAYGARLSAGVAIRVWCLSQATRYLPTSAALIASRVVLANREGVPRSLGAASLGLEVALAVAWTTLVGLLVAPPALVPMVVRVPAVLGVLSGLVLLPHVLQRGGALLRRFPALAPDALHPGRLRGATLLFGLNSVLRAARFALIAAALLPVGLGDVPLIVAASSAGVVAGMIGVTPAGLGVREGVSAAVLATRFPLGEAAVVVVAVRVWDLAFELAFLAVAVWLRRRHRRDDDQRWSASPQANDQGAAARSG